MSEEQAASWKPEEQVKSGTKIIDGTKASGFFKFFFIFHYYGCIIVYIFIGYM